MTWFIDTLFGYGFLQTYILTHVGTLSQGTSLALWIIGAVAIIAVGYLLGSINFAIIISGKTYHEDIRQHGSKNAGMTNMMRTYGKKAAGLTLLGDALKAVVACLFGYALFGQLGAYMAGMACVFGHVFPIFYKFKGGKGVVTTAVTILMCNPFVFIILFALFVAILAMTKYLSLASIMSVLMYPFILNGIEVWLNGGCPYVLFALIIALLVIFKHKDNIKRLQNRTESKFSFKKSVAPPAKTDDNTNSEQ
ncbi:MAG: glycerol-3-phosphate 1-O-acyltransferase PlsY [Ruminococcaceae bacterium]|nr:glycerol-3-phosphate 1-O-acyltransferase PlsY [Oscillospiraceae bacterium]